VIDVDDVVNLTKEEVADVVGDTGAFFGIFEKEMRKNNGIMSFFQLH